eukprot:2371267-Rhodomonas_salina.1
MRSRCCAIASCIRACPPPPLSHPPHSPRASPKREHVPVQREQGGGRGTWKLLLSSARLSASPSSSSSS